MGDINNEKNYVFLDVIGEGSFATVFRAQNKSNGLLFAAKLLKKHFYSKKDIIKCTELAALKRLENHENIMELVDFIYEQTSGKVYMIFDLMDMTLLDYIKVRKKGLSENKSRQFIFQIVSGVNHLHVKGIFHRDIKPENILMKFIHKVEVEQSIILKLSDFGSTASIHSNQPYTEYVATRWYRAPECLLTSGEYGCRMDIWSIGCVFYEIMTLQPLFPGDNEIDQLHKIHEVLGAPTKKQLTRFKHRRVFIQFPKYKPIGIENLLPKLSEDGISVLIAMLKYYPDERISARKLMVDSYFACLRGKKPPPSMSIKPISRSQSTGVGEIVKAHKKLLRSSKEKSASTSNKSIRCNSLSKVEGNEKYLRSRERAWGMRAGAAKDLLLGHSHSHNQTRNQAQTQSQY